MKFAGNFFLVLLFITAAGVHAGEQARLNEAAPDFTLKDNTGKAYTLSDFKGKFIVLEWVNFGCPFVGKHYNSGHMQKLQKMFTGKGVVWLTICSSAKGKQGYFDGKDLDEKIEEKGVNSTAYLIDEDGTVGKMYGAKTTPHMYVIDPTGKLIYVGGIDDRATTDLSDIDGATNYVEDALDEAMAGKPVVVQTARPYGCSVKYK